MAADLVRRQVIVVAATSTPRPSQTKLQFKPCASMPDLVETVLTMPIIRTVMDDHRENCQ
jgi:hypothetical protein